MRATAPKSALLGIVLASCLAGVAPAAELRLAKLFADHMVLQREMPVPVWGWAEPGENIEVSLGHHGASAVTGADGKWTATLPPLKAGGPHTLTVTGRQRARRVEDVLVGDVWLCSGQSNEPRDPGRGPADCAGVDPVGSGPARHRAQGTGVCRAFSGLAARGA